MINYSLFQLQFIVNRMDVHGFSLPKFAPNKNKRFSLKYPMQNNHVSRAVVLF